VRAREAADGRARAPERFAPAPCEDRFARGFAAVDFFVGLAGFGRGFALGLGAGLAARPPAAGREPRRALSADRFGRAAAGFARPGAARLVRFAPARAPCATRPRRADPDALGRGAPSNESVG
jgi:hypothetical protein